jgi:predicted permease
LGFDQMNQSPALHFTYEENTRAFDAIGMWDNTTMSISGIEEPEEVPAMRVSESVFPLLRVPPHLGRVFTAEDNEPGSPRTVILAYKYWIRQFGGDPSVIGQTLRIDGNPVEMIGVMPPHLRFLRYDPDMYLPFRFDRSKLFFGNFSYQGIARLRPGVTLEEANADVARMIPLSLEEFALPPGFSEEMLESAKFGPNVHPLKEDVVGDVGKVLWVLLGTVGLVLLIACANVANLFLVRSEAQHREIAMRTALGATRGRIAAQSLTESMFLGLVGGLAGLGLAYLGIRLLTYLAPANLPRLDEVTIDPNVLLFTLSISIVAGLLFGLFPILHLNTSHLVSALKEGGRGASDGRPRHRLRNLLAVSQVALASILLIGSGLMIRSFRAMQEVHPGFVQPGEVLTMGVYVPSADVEDPEAVVTTHEQIIHRLGQISGVTSVGGSTSITMDGGNSNDPLFVEEFPTPADQIPAIRRYKWITGDYFSTMGNPVIAGRPITWTDIHNRNKVIIITENLAREYWDEPSQAIGKRVRENPKSPWREIVGVVGNIRDDGVNQEPTKTVFWPMAVEDFWGQELTVRRFITYAIRTSRPNPEGILPEAREAIWSVNPNLPLANVQTLQEILDKSMARTAFTLVMLGIAAVVAIILGAIGIYGVISYAVSLRTREIGVRMALGARHADVSRMVLAQGSIVAAIGVAAGLASAFGLTRLMSSLLYGVSAADPMTYVLAAIGVAAVALFATYIPARRAASVDPVEALHWE